MDKKIVTTLIIGIIVIMFSLISLYEIISVGGTTFTETILLSAIIVATIIGMVFVVIQRINEIKKGEENDISKY